MNWRGRRFREHALLSLAFVLTRVWLQIAGLRLYFDLDWMFLADPQDLRERLLETAYYFHSFPPGMNLVTGALLKLAPDHVPWLASGLLKLCGLVLVNSLFYLGRANGLSNAVAFALALGFSLIPQSIYFENLYLYTYLTASLLCLSCALFQWANRRGSAPSWFLFFLVCAAIGWLRSTFHLAWFLVLVAFAVLLERQRARTILLSALAPGLLLSALYLKNLAVFGAFASSTWLGSNLTQATVARMPESLKQSFIEQGKLSPFANLSVFAPTRRYLEFFQDPSLPSDPPALARIERSSGASNYNHRLFLEVNRRRAEDARVYLQAFPLDYAKTFVDSVVQTFGPSTDWHPIKGRRSPHYEHRKVLGPYESLYNGLVHSVFAAPVGLYAFLPLPIFFALRRAFASFRSRLWAVSASAHLVALAAFQIVYVVVVSSLVTRGEASRFRYQVEALLWLLTALGIAEFLRRRKRRRALSPAR